VDILKTFVHHGISGMSLARRVRQTLQPLVYRCECGRQISENKERCKACQDRLEARLGIPQSQPIPLSSLAKAENSKNPAVRKRAVFAKNARSFRH
jgi:hypothetical protein